MKEGTKRLVRAYATRGPLVIQLLAFAFCPFALAQRTARKDVTKRASSSVSEMNQSLLPYDVTVTNRGQRPSSVGQKPGPPAGVWLGVPEASGRPTAGRPNQAFRFMATRGSGCATPTPTATPVCTPTVITGSIDNTDPTQVDRLFRSFTPGDCDHTFTCSTLAAGAIVRCRPAEPRPTAAT